MTGRRREHMEKPHTLVRRMSGENIAQLPWSSADQHVIRLANDGLVVTGV
jgi:hypothetical protein